MNIGRNIKKLRNQKNMTQDQLARAIGVTYQAVSKWETGANTPDIAILPELAALFGVSIDALFSEDASEMSELHSFMKDDDVIRIVQMRGRRILKISDSPASSREEPPIEIAFPRDCNDSTQYFKVEVFGNVIADSSINGDVVCHGTLQSGAINGDVRCEGDIKVSELNAQKVACNNISDCYKLEAREITCAGKISAAGLSCERINNK